MSSCDLLTKEKAGKSIACLWVEWLLPEIQVWLVLSHHLMSKWPLLVKVQTMFAANPSLRQKAVKACTAEPSIYYYFFKPINKYWLTNPSAVSSKTVWPFWFHSLHLLVCHGAVTESVTTFSAFCGGKAVWMVCNPTHAWEGCERLGVAVRSLGSGVRWPGLHLGFGVHWLCD